MIPTSMPRWREISAAAAPMCASAPPSSRRCQAGSRRRQPMTRVKIAPARISDTVSRRSLLKAGLAAALLPTLPRPRPPPPQPRAATAWKVEPSSCTTATGKVTHTESGRNLSYGELAIAASSETPPKDVPLKEPKDFVYVGQSLKRFDTPDKVNGKAIYGIDAMLPDMKFATLASCPVFGGKVGKVDDGAAKKIPGVRKIVVLDDLVAVVGDHMWAAKKGLEALKIDWDEGPNARISSKDVWQDLRAASEKDGVVAKSVGDIAKGLASRDRLDASYELPFLAHATMEPLNATVHVKPDSCEIWTGTQIVSRVQAEAAKAAGLPVDKVVVNNHLLGDGFVRKLGPDIVVAAVRTAQPA